MFMKCAKDSLFKSGCLGIPNWWKIITLLTILYILSCNVTMVHAKKGGRDSKAKPRLTTKPEWVRRKSKNSECRLGKVRHPLNATWNPDLGPPFGVWKCVTCTCTPIQKKRRVVARVICYNHKNECPKELFCENPITKPGTCCKVCPTPNSSLHSEDFVKEEAHFEEPFAGKDFAVFLNGRTSKSPLMTDSLATGRMFLRRGTLHYSFVFDKATPTPSSVQFMDEEGNILEELEPQPTPYEINNGRLCGTWTRVPRQYRSLLMDEKLLVALVISEYDDNIITGRIARYKGVDTEVFSALLAPTTRNQTLPGGGTALISVSPISDSLYISLVFNGIFKSTDARNVTISIELIPTKNLPPVTDTVLLEKVYSDLNTAEVKTTLGEKSLRLLARGKVMIVVSSVENPELRIEGSIISRATCNVYHSVLTSDAESNLVTTTSLVPYGSGWGLVYVLNDGDFLYEMKLEQMTEPIEKIMLQLKTKKKTKDIKDITESFKDGWVNGTYGNPKYRDLDALYRGRLQVAVTMSDGRLVRGIFETISVTEALRSLHPALLKSATSWMAASTWVAVDADCVMHYDVYLAGEDPAHNIDPTWSLHLRENDTTWDPRLDFNNETLEQIITGREIAAHTTTLNKVALSRLHEGVTYLDLKISDSADIFNPTITITGRLTNVKVPQLCLLYPDPVDRTGTEPMDGKNPCQSMFCLDAPEKISISKKCIDDDKRVYDDGSTWKSPVNNCARCMCTLGRIHCQDEPCPRTSCKDPITIPGQCCPSCPVVSGIKSERVCRMDDDNLRNIGSFWHPFLAPKGFDLCVTCYCNISKQDDPVVECGRVECPPLSCLDSEATFDNQLSCCPKCPPSTPPPAIVKLPIVSIPVVKKIDGMVNEYTPAMSLEEKKEMILRNGGCLERQKIARANGETWFPLKSRNTSSKCGVDIACTCKDNNISCAPTKCEEKPRCRKGEKCHHRKGEKSSKYSKKKKRQRRKERRERRRKLM